MSLCVYVSEKKREREGRGRERERERREREGGREGGREGEQTETGFCLLAVATDVTTR